MYDVTAIGELLIDFTMSHPSKLNRFDVENITAFANTVAAISTTKNGGIPSVPSLSEIESFSGNILLK